MVTFCCRAGSSSAINSWISCSESVWSRNNSSMLMSELTGERRSWATIPKSLFFTLLASSSSAFWSSSWRLILFLSRLALYSNTANTTIITRTTTAPPIIQDCRCSWACWCWLSVCRASFCCCCRCTSSFVRYSASICSRSSVFKLSEIVLNDSRCSNAASKLFRFL